MTLSYLFKGTYTFDEEVLAAVGLLDQGTVIHNIEVAYIASGDHPVMDDTRKADLQGTEPLVLPAQTVIVISQTCDLRGKPGERVPMIVVAPVYLLKDVNPTLSVKQLKVAQYVRQLTGDGFANDVYVADLRFEFPVEKSALVGKKAEPGFKTVHDAYEFGVFLSAHRLRPAFSQEVRPTIVELGAFLGESKIADDLWQVRVFPVPSGARATEARFLLIADVDEARLAEIEILVGEWLKAREVEPPLITGITVLRLIEVRVVDTIGSIPFFFDKLSDEPPGA